MKRWAPVVLLTFSFVSVMSSPAFSARRFETKVSLNIIESLAAKGVVRAGGKRHCFQVRKVLVQRRGPGGGWQTIERDLSHKNGAYRVFLPNQAGDYRAFVPKLEIADGTCTRAISRIVVAPV